MYKIGARVLCGFCTTMYLDSREGLYFGRLLGKESVRSAFLNAAMTYQPQLPLRDVDDNLVPIKARAIGLKRAIYEKVNAGQPLAPSYVNNKSLFDILQTCDISYKKITILDIINRKEWI